MDMHRRETRFLMWMMLTVVLAQLIACGGSGGSGGGGGVGVSGGGEGGTDTSDQNPPAITSTAPVITSAARTSLTVGRAATFTISATGDPSPTLALSGALPPGVTFATQTGVLSGTPATGSSGDYPLIITASNGISPNAIQNFTLTVYAAGTAGSVSLPKTGQTGCWDAAGVAITCTGTGQDGDLLKGRAWPNPRFVDNGDQTTTDMVTGLTWTKDANLMKTRDPSFDGDNLDSSLNDGKVTWQHALDYIRKLNSENYQGHNDWRLPNIVELRSLFDIQIVNDDLNVFLPSWFGSQGFINFKSDYYWSSTTGTITPFGALGVDGYYFAPTAGNKANSMFLWPVRGGLGGAARLPRTGQTGCWDSVGNAIICAGTGQDGELQAGVAWPTPRFTDNGNETVTDNLTQLVWTKNGLDYGPAACGPAESRSWQAALNYVKCLNSIGYLGQNDWRLPNPNELRSLLNYQEPRIWAWLNREGFYNVQGSEYVTSSTVVRPGWTGFAWFEDMVYGFETGYSKAGPRFVWVVRAGN